MTHKYFCTLFYSNYLLKGVAMLRSIHRHCPEARVFVLCMDEEAGQVLEKLGMDWVSCISLTDVEDDDLRRVKPGRGIGEYCWTLSPCLPWYVLQHNPDIDLITYLDADLLFYSSVQPLFDEIGTKSIAIIEHRLAPRFKDREVNGRFCVEWVSFRRDEEGMSCLSRWRDQCIEWCFYRLEDGRMGDQKYLDEWPERYRSLHILQHPGAGVAPWNYAQYVFGQSRDGQITVEGAPLVFYHFHQFQILGVGRYDRLSKFYTMECPEPDAVYKAYENALGSVLADVRRVSPGFSEGFTPAVNIFGRRLAQRYLPRSVKDFLHNITRY